ncbi:MAG: aminoglycoside phosphotransferase [Porticoccaceae bacterium]|nr:aminoglycoside phosphotransferase [Porticoccaceae bacterium]
MSSRHPKPLDLNPLDARIYDNLLNMLGGDIVGFRRQTRWRPAWDVDMLIDGEPHRLNVRAEKGKKYANPMNLHQEAGIHDILEKYDVPAPHVYGMMDDPTAIVMELIPGQINLETARDDAARESIRAQYVEVLANLHDIPVDEFASLGLTVPSTPRDIALNLYRDCEAIYRKRMAGRPFALMDFIWHWVQSNIPEHRNRAAFITADSGQFLFQGDKLTGLIDFEVGYVGDPIAEFAGMRLRDSTEPLGDINTLMDHYEQLTGDRMDKNSVEYHTAGFCAVNGFLLWPLAFDPDIADDFVAYLSFSVGTTRWAIEAIAEVEGVTLDDIEPPAAAPLGYPAAPRHLVKNLAQLPMEGEFAEYDKSKAVSLALYLERANLYGRSVIEQNLADVAQLTGKQFDDPDDAEKAMVDHIAGAGPEQMPALTRYFHRWLQRQDFLLRECGASSWGTGIKLQAIRHRDR